MENKINFSAKNFLFFDNIFLLQQFALMHPVSDKFFVFIFTFAHSCQTSRSAA